MAEHIRNISIDTPMLHLVYSSTDLRLTDDADIADRIGAFENTPPSESIRLSWSIQQAQKCLGQIDFGNHQIQVSGLAMPLPPVIMDRTIHVSPWQPQIKASLRQHQTHISLVYTGSHHDPVERMIALYQSAHALSDENLLGMVNEPAWTAHPAADFLDPGAIATYRAELPFTLWVGYVRFYTDKHHYWLATKGHHIFDVPDLACFIESDQDENEIITHFKNIFYYFYDEDAEVIAGDTLAIAGSDQVLKFSEVTELTDQLMGPSGTLVIEKVPPSDLGKTLTTGKD